MSMRTEYLQFSMCGISETNPKQTPVTFIFKEEKQINK